MLSKYIFSQMSTHLPRFQLFFLFFLHHLVMNKLATSSSVRVNSETPLPVLRENNAVVLHSRDTEIICRRRMINLSRPCQVLLALTSLEYLQRCLDNEQALSAKSQVPGMECIIFLRFWLPRHSIPQCHPSTTEDI